MTESPSPERPLATPAPPSGRRRQTAVRLVLLAVLAWSFVGESTTWSSLKTLWPDAQHAAAVTSSLQEWAGVPAALAFRPPGSRCTLHPDGSVELPQGRAPAGSTPPLFDIDNVVPRRAACGHCVDADNGTASADPDIGLPNRCCGVCMFEGRRCGEIYRGQGRSEATLQQLLDSGYRLQDLTPCELFARIRGRTLWFVGDSQMRDFYDAAECFLREFAPSLRRTTPLGRAASQELTTVTVPRVEPSVCLKLAQNTRICTVRVDWAHDLMNVVLTQLADHVPNLSNDIMLFNTGLHYVVPGRDGRPVNQSDLVFWMTAFTKWWRQHAALWPRLIWVDTAVQHFDTPDGAYPGGTGPFTCVPLKAWYEGDPTVRAGTLSNALLEPLIPRVANAHLRTWNASIPLWNTHMPSDCTHWCNPSAYHLWIYLLNNLLRDNRLGSWVQVPERTATVVAAEAAAVAAAEAAAAAQGALRQLCGNSIRC